MALLDPPRSDLTDIDTVVATIVVTHGDGGVADALEAVERQVYEAASVSVVGPEKAKAGGLGARAEWHGSLREALAGLPDEVTHFWLVHADSIPRPDALGALVRESTRVRAGLAGSKVLRSGLPGVLESVGMATDVFAMPHRGLEPLEVDQEQYDVVRDVAFVSGASMLVQREVMEKVGEPDSRLEPTTAAIDYCQRVRLAGYRVVVVPSAEVMHDGACYQRQRRWRFEAGRLVAILKAYTPMTLLWVLPLHVLVGLAVAFLDLFRGRFRFLSLGLAWSWNLFHLRTTFAARNAVLRVNSDEELFRYQVRGSVALGSIGRGGIDRVRRLIAGNGARNLSHWVGTGSEAMLRPAVADAALAMAAVAFATRQAWSGLAAHGYTLLPPDSPSAALAAYAGGWNPAGLGSPEPLRPMVAVVAGVQGLLFGNAQLAIAVLTVGAAFAGVFGVSRLLAPWAFRPAARYIAGVVYVLGPGARWVGSEGLWPGLIALGLLPWAVVLAVHRRGWIGSVSALALVIGALGAFIPMMLVAPLGVVAIWSAIGAGDRVGPLARVGLATVLAPTLLYPWLGSVESIGDLLASGRDGFWEPSVWVIMLAVVLGAVVMTAADEAVSTVGGFAAASTFVGLALARTGGLGAGLETAAGGAIVGGLGLALMVACGVELAGRLGNFTQWWRAGSVIGGLAAGLLLLGTVTLLITGRSGLPNTDAGVTLGVTAELGEGNHRVLWLGEEAELLGESRTAAGTSYRLTSTPDPRLWELWLDAPREGDGALHDVVTRLLGGETFRVGEELAEFGVRWVLAPIGSMAAGALDTQLDLRPLGLTEMRGYESEVPGFRATDTRGQVWQWRGDGYYGPEGTRTVRINENPDVRWGESWEQVDWANQVTTTTGTISFGPIQTLRSAAIRSALLVAGLLLIAAVVRDRW